MSLSSHVDVPTGPTWSPALVRAPEPTPVLPTEAIPDQRHLPPGDRSRTELADLPDLRTGKAVIDRWVDELLAADALDEVTTDVFERLIDDWADRFRQRLLQDSLDREAQAEASQAAARAEAAGALLVRRRAEREYAFALAELEAVRRRARTLPVDPGTPPDGPWQGREVPGTTSTAPDLADQPEDGQA